MNLSGPRQHDMPSLSRRPVIHGDMANALDKGGAGARRNVVDHGVALLAVVGGDLDLDQLVMLQCGVHLGNQCIGNALAAHLQHCFQIVCLAAQEAGLGIGERGRHTVSNGALGEAQGIMATQYPWPSMPMATRRHAFKK